MTTIIDNKLAFRTMLAMKFDELSVWQKTSCEQYGFTRQGACFLEKSSEVQTCRGFTGCVAVPYEDLPEDATPTRVTGLQICCQNKDSVSVYQFDAVRIQMDDENRVAIYRGESDECE